MFVDASALIAMLTDETDARLFAARLQSTSKRLTSPIAVVEASLGVSKALGLSVAKSEEAVRRFLELMGIQLVSLPVQAVAGAIEALGRFRLEAGHSAGLETNDAFAYACARYYRVPLLYKAARFAATDIEAA